MLIAPPDPKKRRGYRQNVARSNGGHARRRALFAPLPGGCTAARAAYLRGMSCAFFIDRRQRVLLAKFGRTVTLKTLAELNAAVRRHAAAEGPFRGIVDLSAVEEVLISSHQVAELGRQPPLLPGQQRAIVAPRDEVFGLSRMFGLHRAITGDEPAIVRTLAAAYEQLGLTEPDFVPIDLSGPSAAGDTDKPAR
jgi:hypothetical protein